MTEPFYQIHPCEACSELHGHYARTYSALMEEKDKVRLLSEEKDAMVRAHDREIRILQSQIMDHKFYLDRETAACDGLQGKLIPGMPECLNCATHITAFKNFRAHNISGMNNVLSRYAELQTLLKEAEKEAWDQRTRVGRLNAQLNQKDPLVNDRVIQDMKAEKILLGIEVRDLNTKLNAVTKDRDMYIRKWNDIKERADMTEGQLSEARFQIEQLRGDGDDSLKRKIRDLEAQLSNPNKKLKQEEPVEEPAEDIPSMEDFLSQKFRLVFSVLDTEKEESEENFLYDAFLNSIPLDEHEKYLEAIYVACHPGGSLPLRDRNAIKTKSSRVCKLFFSECLRAIGGMMKMKGSKRIWTNISIRRT